jgi:hypothetical protein
MIMKVLLMYFSSPQDWIGSALIVSGGVPGNNRRENLGVYVQRPENPLKSARQPVEKFRRASVEKPHITLQTVLKEAGYKESPVPCPSPSGIFHQPPLALHPNQDRSLLLTDAEKLIKWIPLTIH